MATVYKIHPAIGIARVGNSPDEFFIGPERIGQPPDPPGGFKDAQCRVKRQAARFRIFAHHDDGTVDEITDAEAEITWTVAPGQHEGGESGPRQHRTAAELTIDPGARTLAAARTRRQKFDTGTIKFANAPVTTVPLGEIRSDAREPPAGAGRLRQVGVARGDRARRLLLGQRRLVRRRLRRSGDGDDQAARRQLDAAGRRRVGDRRAAEVRARPGQRDHAVRPDPPGDGRAAGC